MPGVHDTIRQMRELLTLLEAEVGEDDVAFLKNFDALEVPAIVASIVDFLQPVLLPYEAAIYWHLFRKSILASGQQYVRASVRGLAEGVIQSSSGQSTALAYKSPQRALQGLEQKGAIVKVGETTRDGTLYKICLPEEIPLCQEQMKAASKVPVDSVDARKELDFYNVPENRLKVFERDGYKCRYCLKQLTRFSATLDHVQPVSESGDNSFDNLVTACLHCNSKRGNRPVMDALKQA